MSNIKLNGALSPSNMIVFKSPPSNKNMNQFQSTLSENRVLSSNNFKFLINGAHSRQTSQTPVRNLSNERKPSSNYSSTNKKTPMNSNSGAISSHHHMAGNGQFRTNSNDQNILSSNNVTPHPQMRAYYHGKNNQGANARKHKTNGNLSEAKTQLLTNSRNFFQNNGDFSELIKSRMNTGSASSSGTHHNHNQPIQGQIIPQNLQAQLLGGGHALNNNSNSGISSILSRTNIRSKNDVSESMDLNNSNNTLFAANNNVFNQVLSGAQNSNSGNSHAQTNNENRGIYSSMTSLSSYLQAQNNIDKSGDYGNILRDNENQKKISNLQHQGIGQTSSSNQSTIQSNNNNNSSSLSLKSGVLNQNTFINNSAISSIVSSSLKSNFNKNNINEQAKPMTMINDKSRDNPLMYHDGSSKNISNNISGNGNSSLNYQPHMATSNSNPSQNTQNSSSHVTQIASQAPAPAQAAYLHPLIIRDFTLQQDEIYNSTIILTYKGNKLTFKYPTQDHNVQWLITFIILEILKHEREVLKNSQPDQSIIGNLIGFQSSQGNIALSYYFTQKKRDLELFINQNLNIELITFDQLAHIQQYPGSSKINLKDFHLVQCIGLGGFSRVYLVQKKDTGMMYALQLIDKEFILTNKKEVIVQNERNIMSIISHPFILKLEYAFENKHYLGFVMEYCAGGELFYHIRRIKRMTEDQARFYFTEICLGIQYLHDRHIIYRDIKPQNILLDIDGHVRIGDFGLAKPNMDEDEFAYSFCGSPEYMAPEMLLQKGHNSAVDHYCLGALLYELITGLPPYYSHNTDEIYEAILYEDLTFPDNLHISPQLKDLLHGLLKKIPDQRLGCDEGLRDVFKHPWFKKVNFKDIFEQKIPPPIKPNILAFNFDEEEFSKGEIEFRHQLLQSMNAVDNGALQFKDFYFDRQAYLAQQKKLNDQKKRLQEQQEAANILQHQQLQQQQRIQQQQLFLQNIRQSTGPSSSNNNNQNASTQNSNHTNKIDTQGHHQQHPSSSQESNQQMNRNHHQLTNANLVNQLNNHQLYTPSSHSTLPGQNEHQQFIIDKLVSQQMTQQLLNRLKQSQLNATPARNSSNNHNSMNHQNLQSYILGNSNATPHNLPNSQNNNNSIEQQANSRSLQKKPGTGHKRDGTSNSQNDTHSISNISNSYYFQPKQKTGSSSGGGINSSGGGINSSGGGGSNTKTLSHSREHGGSGVNYLMMANQNNINQIINSFSTIPHTTTNNNVNSNNSGSMQRGNSKSNLKGNLREMKPVHPKNSSSVSNNSLLQTSTLLSTKHAKVPSTNSQIIYNNFMSNFPGHPSQSSIVPNPSENLRTDPDQETSSNILNSINRMRTDQTQVFQNVPQKKKPSNSSKSLAHQKNVGKMYKNHINNSDNFSGILTNSINSFNIQPSTTTATGSLYGYIQQVSGQNNSLSPSQTSQNNLKRYTPLGFA